MNGPLKVYVPFLLDAHVELAQLLQYETGLTKYYDGQNSAVLMCLARTWYAKATRDQSFASMKTALRLAQQVIHSPYTGSSRADLR